MSTLEEKATQLRELEAWALNVLIALVAIVPIGIEVWKVSHHTAWQPPVGYCPQDE
jgi:hypothetical protein